MGGLFLIAQMSQNPANDTRVLNTGNDSDSPTAAAAGTIDIYLTSQREWRSVGLLWQGITRYWQRLFAASCAPWRTGDDEGMEGDTDRLRSEPGQRGV